jgi:hypothetical protein
VAEPYAQCVSALSACDSLTKAQDAQITTLKASINVWRVKAEGGDQGEGSVLMAGILAGLTGGAVIGTIEGPSKGGVALGAGLGGLVGLGVGYLIGEVAR